MSRSRIKSAAHLRDEGLPRLLIAVRRARVAADLAERYRHSAGSTDARWCQQVADALSAIGVTLDALLHAAQRQVTGGVDPRPERRGKKRVD